MRLAALSLALSPLIAACPTPAAAQDGVRTPPAPGRPADATSDERAAEIRNAIKRAQVRQRTVEARNTRIWRRWDYAVCIGCGPVPKGLRIVHTTPARVLAGHLAADDDAAPRSVRRG